MNGLMPTALAAAMLVATVPGRAAEQVLELDPEATDVGFTLEATGHDVEGLLALSSGSIRFDSATGAASGEIVVDLASAASGNRSRDKTMHKKVLESAAYPIATFRPERLIGPLQADGVSDVALHGTLSLRGTDHAMELPANVAIEGDRMSAETSFPIPYVEWGLHDPSWMLLKVAKVVAVHIHAEGRLVAPGGEADGAP